MSDQDPEQPPSAPPPPPPPEQPPEQPYGQPYGQPHGQPAYGQSPYGAYPQASGTNGMAIAGFVCAFFCTPLGLIFSIIGLNQINQSGQGGKGLAIAGIVISI